MKKPILLFLLPLLLASGCGKDEIKPSEDSLLATEAFSSVELLRTAYTQKDTALLKDKVQGQLADVIINNMIFQKVDLSFNPRVVRITGALISVNINWQGTWWLQKKRQVANRGAASLVLERESMRLVRIDGDNPFQIPILP